MRTVVSTLATLVVLGALPSTAHAFDSAWHRQATVWAAKRTGLESGIDVLTVGNFAPDFFGPVYDKGSSWLPRPVLKLGWGKLIATRDVDDPKRRLRLRNAATFLHFDDLGEALDSNERFAWIFTQLLENTRHELIRIHADPALDARTKRILILLTLGSSLHMVQDFYSHTNWTHLAPVPPRPLFSLGLQPLPDGAKSGLRAAGLIAVGGGVRTVTWFELPGPSAKFHVRSGSYPDPKRLDQGPATDEGTPKAHACMNHDSSALDGVESPLRYHKGGPVSASRSIEAHQAVAVDTASWASAEWIRKVEEDAGAHAALELARAGDAKFESEPSAIARLSCAAEHWNGKNGTWAGVHCSNLKLLERTVLAVGIAWLVPSAVPTIHDELWRAFAEHDILEHLVVGFGNESTGRYQFVKP
jgi:hypothetical protein